MVERTGFSVLFFTQQAMTKPTSTPAPSSTKPKPLVKALVKNDSVKAVVKQSAEELLVVNAVLKKGIPDHAQTGDVAQAIEKTEDIEDRIQTSAEELATVNKLLEHEIDERIDLERELLATKTALAREKSKP
jgi:hypothetical protein